MKRYFSRKLLLSCLFSFLCIQSSLAQAPPVIGGDPTTAFTTNDVAATGSNFVDANGVDNFFGTGNDQFITGFSTAAGTFSPQFSSNFVVRRRSADVVHDIFMISADNGINTGNVTEAQATEPNFADPSLAFATDNIAIGADNVFDSDLTNVERIDTLFPTGAQCDDAADLDNIGFLLIERNGGLGVFMSPITSLDANGDPDDFGNVVEVNTSGGLIFPDTTDYNQYSYDSTSGGTVYSGAVSNQTLEGSFISFADLGVTAGQRVYGFALMGDDVNITASGGTDLVDVTDSSVYPTTGGSRADILFTGALYTLDGGKDTSSLPVTLSTVASTRAGNSVQVKFQTASEERNIGFKVFVNDNGRRVDLGNLIPSTGTSPDGVTDYEATIPVYRDSNGRVVRKFLIASVDGYGQEEYFGPFRTGKEYGKFRKIRKVDWGKVSNFLTERGFTVDAGQAISHRNTRWAARVRRLLRRFPQNVAEQLEVAASDTGVWARIPHDGFFSVSADSLRASGLDFDALSDVAVSHKGVAVARLVDNDSIHFYAEGPSSEEGQYQSERRYLINVDARLKKDALFTDAPSSSGGDESVWSSLHLEENLLYDPQVSSEDPWYWHRLFVLQGRQASFEIPFTIDKLMTTLPGSLDLSLVGASEFASDNPDHRVEVEVNGELVHSETNQGAGTWNLSIPLASDALLPGDNTVRVTLFGDTGNLLSAVYVDSLAVNYFRPLVAQEGEPLGFQGDAQQFRLRAASAGSQILAHKQGELYRVDGLQSDDAIAFAGLGEDTDFSVSSTGSHGEAELLEAPRKKALAAFSADYLVITHPSFAQEAALQTFVSRKRGEGHTTQVVSVQDIYDKYSEGVATPVAIRDYLKEASQRFDYKYVLLVGADSYDRFDVSGVGAVSFVPTLYTETSKTAHTASDAQLVDFDGDRVPDKAIGRWPCRTGEELSRIVAKNADYNTSVKGANTSLFVAEGTREADFAMQMTNMQRLVGATRDDWSQRDQLYFDEFRRENSGLEPNVLSANLRGELAARLNEGVQLMVFDGHGSPTLWGRDQILTSELAGSLQNQGRPTVMMPLACYTSFHNSPSTETLAHQLLMESDGGAVAIHGASTLSSFSANNALASAALKSQLEGSTLGESILEAKKKLAEDGDRWADVIVNWDLLGDPSLKLDDN